ncbi:MAG: IgGFc-binding protein [Polyangiales bacterium]
MSFHRPFLLALVFLSLACGDDDQVDTCTQDSQCAPGICVDGACVEASDGGAADAPESDAGPVPDVPFPDAGPVVGSGCSADLRSTLDSSGEVLRECPADEGCFDGVCVPACDAAEEAKGNLGCEFRVPTANMWTGILPPCFAVFVTNSWAADLSVQVERDGMLLEAREFGRIVDSTLTADMWPAIPETGVPIGEVAVLFLSSDPDAAATGGGRGGPLTCPVAPAINASTEVRGPGTGSAFTITTSAPVSAYDILPFGGASSFLPGASLLLPTSVWAEDYIVVTPPPGTHTQPGPLWIQVVAEEDGTLVEVRPTADLVGDGSVPSISAGTTGSITLNAGEYVQWESASADPSGSIVHADRPVGVHAGNRFLRLQATPSPGGDAQHQQLLPVTALANEYVASPYPTRRSDLAPESIGYRLVGAYDETALTFDPPLAGAPATLDQGEVVDLMSDVPFIVRSQDDAHPFAFAQVMSSGQVPGGWRAEDTTFDIFDSAVGDEEMTLIFPAAQFLRRYVFFTDPTYGITSLALTRTRGETGFADVRVDCLGVIEGWTPVGSDGEYEVVSVDLMRGGVGVDGCLNGRHSAESEGDFGMTVWGYDSYASYAYPAGGNASTLRELPPLL